MALKKWHHTYFIGFYFFLAISCLEPYKPSVIKNAPSHLVIDAFLNSDESSAYVRLSRTISLSETGKPPAESHASVAIEDESGQTFQLEEKDAGHYFGFGLLINPSHRYRLTIQTSDQNQFRSEFISIRQTPRIDSVAWTLRSEGGLDINVSTHDETGSTRFYRWDYTETWEYTSKYVAGFRLENGHAVELPFEDSPFSCWKTEHSTNILVGSTSGLTKDHVSNFRLAKIAQNSSRLTVDYSILVRQYALTEEEYTYWINLKKNTESLGGLFDPLPSQVAGNIHAIGDADVIAIGFFSAGSVTEKRIFIRPGDLPEKFSTFQHPVCAIDTVLNHVLPTLSNSTLLVYPVYNDVPAIIGYLKASNPCVDCRLWGGRTSKPDFWD